MCFYLSRKDTKKLLHKEYILEKLSECQTMSKQNNFSPYSGKDTQKIQLLLVIKSLVIMSLRILKCEIMPI